MADAINLFPTPEELNLSPAASPTLGNSGKEPGAAPLSRLDTLIESGMFNSPEQIAAGVETGLLSSTEAVLLSGRVEGGMAAVAGSMTSEEKKEELLLEYVRIQQIGDDAAKAELNAAEDKERAADQAAAEQERGDQNTQDAQAAAEEYAVEMAELQEIMDEAAEDRASDGMSIDDSELSPLEELLVEEEGHEHHHGHGHGHDHKPDGAEDGPGMSTDAKGNKVRNEDVALVSVLQEDADTSSKTINKMQQERDAGPGSPEVATTEPNAAEAAATDSKLTEVGAYKAIPVDDSSDFAKLQSQFAGLVDPKNFPNYAVGAAMSGGDLGSIASTVGLPSKGPAAGVGAGVA